MANLKQLKLKRQSVNKTAKVTRAMEAVSAVKMQKSQENALSGRSFAVVALRILNALSFDIENSSHDLVVSKDSGKKGLLLITSDKGLAGSLNSSVLKKAQEFIDREGAEKIVAIAIGRRAHEFLRRRKVEIIYKQDNKQDEVKLSDTLEISEHIINAHLASKTRSWHIAYMNFVSTFDQMPVFRQVLPLSESELEALVKDIAPKTGKYSDEQIKDKEISPNLSYTIESDAENILDDLIKSLVNIMVHHSLLESKASEHSARMVAMKSATDKAKELSHDLLLKFNKARQAAITREVSEITSGVEAMKE